MYSSETLTLRLHKLQDLLAGREIDLAILHYATDLVYYTGSSLPLYLLVPQKGEARVVARKALARIAEEVALPLSAFSSSKEMAAIFTEVGAGEAAKVGLTLDTLSYNTVQRLQPLFPRAEMVDLAWDIRTLRMVKSPDEIAVIARGGRVMGAMADLIREHFRPGITELELSAALEYAFRRQGNEMVIRCRREGMEMAGCGVCTAGLNTLAGTKFEGVCGGVGLSSAVPFGVTAEPIPPHTPVLIDYGFVLEGYHIDQTRMACWGEPPAEAQRAFDAMLEVEEVVFAALCPGTPWEEIYRVAVDRAAQLGHAEGFMGLGSEQVKFIGHGVGLELDEPPILAPRMQQPLEAGMVLAIEPKVALPGLGMVGIEDTVVLREDGIERLTVCPREMVIVG
ncbi:MAG: M24 family metallopeptidase [Armatimonadota bacterium]